MDFAKPLSKKKNQVIKKTRTLGASVMEADLSQSQYEEAPGITEKIISVEIFTDGYTKMLRFTERNKEAQIAQNMDEFRISKIPVSDKSEKGTNLAKSVTSLLSKKNNDKQLNRLESVDEIDVLYEVGDKIKRESKFQLDIRMLYISFIARSDRKIRREFLLGYLEGMEFLVIDSEEDRKLQFKLSYFQLDNNINSEGR
jgi:hypothetical protein